MKRVGILVGREKTFPEALISNINERGNGLVAAEYVTLGGVRHALDGCCHETVRPRFAERERTG